MIAKQSLSSYYLNGKSDFTHVMRKGCINLTRNDDWSTPWWLYRKAISEFHIIPLVDVCATRENRKCTNYFSPRMDGLKQDWIHNFFMNPPYSNVKEWVAKAYHEHKKWKTIGLALLYSKTDTSWWHEYIEGKAEVHFIKGRIRFLKEGRPSQYTAPYPSCWVIWRN